MVAMASRKRDKDGRYMEGDEMRRMDGDMEMLRMNESADMRRMDGDMEMRRRRDGRGRYMAGDDGDRMAWREPHIPPYATPENRRMAENRMRDRNVVNIRDYQDRRQIGFAPRSDDDEEDEMRQYGRRYNPDRPKMIHGAGREPEHRMGMAEGDDTHLSREDAEMWVESMRDADGKRGGRWTFEEIERYAPNFGVKQEEVIDFFAVLNALYTDYGKVAKKFGFDRMEVWAEMAKAFIHDKDAEPGKVKLYYECITKKEE